MKVVIAIDSFKGSLSTFSAADAVALGVKRAIPDAETVTSPLADGGEGTALAITCATGGKMRSVCVSGPLGDKVTAKYGITPNGTAVIEMAEASGLTLIPKEKRNPLHTSTRGTGELILDAIRFGCRKFIIGIGGSATNDGGMGMLRALGAEFFDKNGSPVCEGAIGLRDLAKIKNDNIAREIAECDFTVACDVKNPLCGENGCSRVYAPQKGATEEMIADMDAWLREYAELTKTQNPKADENYPGAGAAGGLGFAFLSYLGAHLRSGIDTVTEATGLEEHIKSSDIVITGEGRFDGQSLMGKAPIGVARLAKKYGKPVIAIAGGVTDDAVAAHALGVDAIFPIVRGPISLESAMDEAVARKNISATTEQIIRLILATNGKLCK